MTYESITFPRILTSKFPLSLTFDDVNLIPRYSEIISRENVDLTARFTRNYEIETPIISSPMDTITGDDMVYEMGRLGGVGISHRFCTIEEQCNMIDEDYEVQAAAIGVTGNFVRRAERLVESGVNVLLLDVAHGHHVNVKTAMKWLESLHTSKIDIIGGSVATTDGAKFLCDLGFDAIRVGIGNGAVCETRIRTGVGVPQISALWDVVTVCDEYNIPVIADGGMRTPADVAKALAIGADTCMFGSLFSGTKESPGTIRKSGMWPNEVLYKSYRGSASRDVKLDHGMDDKNIEGNSTRGPYKGKVGRIVTDIEDGIRSACSYVGANNISELQKNARFVRVTCAGRIEATPHLIK